jgi:hypothetical protein
VIRLFKVERDGRGLLRSRHGVGHGGVGRLARDAIPALAPVEHGDRAIRGVICDDKFAGAAQVVPRGTPDAQLFRWAVLAVSNPCVDVEEREGDMWQREPLIACDHIPSREVVAPWAGPTAPVVMAEELEAHREDLVAIPEMALPQIYGGKGRALTLDLVDEWV